MSARTQSLLEQIKALPANEQAELRNEVNVLTKERQLTALNRLYGCGKGEGLLAKLLEERAKERSRG